MQKRKEFLLIFSLFLILCSCNEPTQKVRIGLSHADIKGGWGVNMYNEMQWEILFYQDLDIELLVKNAKSKSANQIAQIDSLVNENIDILIVFPYLADSITQIIEDTYDAGIPVILLDQRFNTSKFNAFLGSNSVEIGKAAAEYAATVLNDKGDILEIRGVVGSNSSQDRAKGFNEVINDIPGLKVTEVIYGDWEEEVTKIAVDRLLKKGYQPDLVFAHNDEMAGFASEIFKKYNQDPFIIGVDGLALPGQGVDMVLEDKIDVAFLNPSGGDKAIQLAISILRGEKVSKLNTLQTLPIDRRNARIFKNQYQMLVEQYDKIEKQRNIIQTLSKRIDLQKVITITSLLFTLSLLVFSFLLIRSFRQKQKMLRIINNQKEEIEKQWENDKILSEKLSKQNKILTEQKHEILQQNEEILSQRDTIVDHNEQLNLYKNELESLVEERTRELQEALRKAQESDKLKTSFLENMSHELRTPLNAILGFSEVIFSEDLQEAEKQRFKEIIYSSSQELLDIVSDIIELSSLSAQNKKLELITISCHQFFNAVENKLKDKYQTIINDKKKDLKLIIEKSNDAIIETNPTYLALALDKLMNNAVKFTTKGSVVLGYNIEDDKYLTFYVKDTGIGIKQEYFSAIFDKFRKIEDNKELVFRGNGLGLTIAESICKKLKSSIVVESIIGEGSTFYIKHPLKNILMSLEKDKKEFTKVSLAGLKILIVEDEESNLAYINVLLKQENVVCVNALNGKEAVDLFTSTPDFDIVLMDIKMPVMDGFEAFEKIKSIAPEMLVVALTAFAFSEDRERILKMGFDDFISKPVSKKTLMQTLIALYNKRNNQ